MLDRSPCHACGKEVMWARTIATNTLMPLDVEPVPEGNIVIVDNRAHVLHGDLFDPMIAGPRYQSHVRSCPKALELRLSKKKRK